MPSNAVLYTSGVNMEAAYVLSASSAASGHAKENVVDWNPDTYWAASGVGTAEIVIDLGAATLIDRAAIWINNYNVNLNPGSAQSMKVYHSPDASTWTQWAGAVPLPGDSTQQFLFSDVAGAAVTKRYWKIELICPTIVCEVKHVYLCNTYGITQGNQLPENDQQSYLVDKYTAHSGRVLTNLLQTHKQQTFNRSYLFVTSGDWETLNLVKAWNACRGDWRPLILTEDSTTQLVRFAGPITRNMEAYQVYRPQVTWITEPFIEAGRTL